MAALFTRARSIFLGQLGRRHSLRRNRFLIGSVAPEKCSQLYLDPTRSQLCSTRAVRTSSEWKKSTNSRRTLLENKVIALENNTNKTSTNKVNDETRINILSFDGGGSRGVMEVFILKDVMNMVTILMNEPDRLVFPNSKENCVKLREMLDNVNNPIHPTEVFKFIVGTSTGALIAFGLVGGKQTGYERRPFTVDEIVEMYKKHIAEIFSKQVRDKHLIHRLLNKVACWFLSVPTEPYSQEGLESLLKNYFGCITLANFPKPKGCIAGAVALQIFKTRPDKMVIFTSGKDGHHRVTDILKASAAAPVFFKTPVEILGDKFIDGGVGGNCPLQQALSKAPELFGDTTKVELVVSIAAPQNPEVDRINDCIPWYYWSRFFLEQVSDGRIIFHDCKMTYPAITFERLLPESEDAGKFKMDETDVKSMIECMEKESVDEVKLKGESTEHHLQYFEKIAKTSGKLVLTSYSSLSSGTLSTINKLLQNIGERAKQLNNFEVDNDCCMWSLKALTLMHGEDVAHPDIALTLSNIGYCQQKLGQWSEAFGYHRKALVMMQQLYREDVAHPDIALTLNSMGVCQQNRFKYSEAFEYISMALVMQYKLCGEDKTHPHIALTLNNIGSCQQKLGQYSEAFGYFRKALVMMQHLHGEDVAHHDIALILNNMGGCQEDLDQWKEAFNYYKKALVMEQQLHGEDVAHPHIALILSNMGVCQQEFGQYSEALKYFSKALAMIPQLYEEDVVHPEIAPILNNMGECKQKLGQWSEALGYFRKALVMLQKLYGEDVAHPDIALTLNNMGCCQREIGQYSEALSYFSKALAMLQHLYGEDVVHRDIALILNNMGVCQQEFGQLSEAFGCFSTALAMMQKLYGEDVAHRDIALTLNNMGDCKQKLGQWSESLGYYRKALVMEQHLHGEDTDHHNIAKILNNIGTCQQKLGQYSEAFGYFSTALAMMQKLYGEDVAHPEIALTLNNMGGCKQKLGQWSEALGYFRKALVMLQKLYGEDTDHPDIAKTLKNIRTCQKKLG